MVAVCVAERKELSTCQPKYRRQQILKRVDSKAQCQR